MPSRSLDDACSYLKEAIPLVIEKYNGRYVVAGLEARVGDVLRTAGEQAKDYAIGRNTPGDIVTNCDGYTMLSDHQAKELHGETCSHAVDIIVLADDGRRYVGDARWYHAILGLGISVGLKGGGDWLHPDFPHLACPHTTP